MHKIKCSTLDSESPFPFPPLFSCREKTKENILPSTTKSAFSLAENLTSHYLGLKKKKRTKKKLNKILLSQTFSLNMHIFIFMSINSQNVSTVTWENLTPDLLVVVFLWMMIHHLDDLSYWLQYFLPASVKVIS